ncbi:MAG: hypothetical protein HY904_14520 [Deltaproteobacteria bacterium]|nr:hypothetical protein [Deltaproteobacteria bacterium]
MDRSTWHPTRRLFLWGAVVGTGAATVAVHASGYGWLAGFPGEVLATWEGHVVAAAAERLLNLQQGGPTPSDVARHVDRFLVGMPPSMHQDIHLMLGALEHGTLPLGLRFSRLTRLPAADRVNFLAGLPQLGTLMAQAYRGVRDLCLLGYWQDPRTWARIGYGGPWGASTANGHARHVTGYDALVAPAAALPRSALP